MVEPAGQPGRQIGRGRSHWPGSACGPGRRAELGQVCDRRRGEAKRLAEVVGVADDVQAGMCSERDERVVTADDDDVGDPAADEVACCGLFWSRSCALWLLTCGFAWRTGVHQKNQQRRNVPDQAGSQFAR